MTGEKSSVISFLKKKGLARFAVRISSWGLRVIFMMEILSRPHSFPLLYGDMDRRMLICVA